MDKLSGLGNNVIVTHRGGYQEWRLVTLQQERTLQNWQAEKGQTDEEFQICSRIGMKCSDPVERSELLTALMVTRLLPAMRRLLGEGFVWSGSECNISRGERQAGGQQNLGTPLPSEYRRALGLESRYQEHTWECACTIASR